MTICRRNLLELDDLIDNPIKCLVRPSEWEILTSKNKPRNRIGKTSSVAPVRKSNLNVSPSVNSKFISSKKEITTFKSPSIVTLKLPGIEEKQMYSTTKTVEGFNLGKLPKDEPIKAIVEIRKPAVDTEERVDIAHRMILPMASSVPNPHDNLVRDVKTILERLGKKFPQFKINGENNIWIAKPAGLSRGRGIQVFSDLDEIDDYTRGKEHNWILQKYIENPLIVNKRKFDLRIWVLVTDVNPLTIWFWKKPYVRFPAADYNADNLNDRFIHLTNNSVAKNAKELPQVGDGNMWFIEQLQSHFVQTYGRDIWSEEIEQKCKDIIIHSLQAVQDCIDNRKGSMELLGYDVMIDDTFNPWLIEVNSSPTMEFSTGVTKALAQNVMESVVKVISDYCMAPLNKKKSEIDTGDFTMIYKGMKYNEKGLNVFGPNFC